MNLLGVYNPRPASAAGDQKSLIAAAMAKPIGKPRLRDVVRRGQRIAILTSDLTRPCPSQELLPFILEELGAAGVSDRATGAKLTADQPHRMASNTKTYVSATALRLYEDGKLKLDAPIATLLSRESIETLRRGGYDPNVITVRHLLTHTSGIFDYAMSAPYQEAALSNSARRWTRAAALTVVPK